MAYGGAEQKVDPTEYRVPRNFKLLDELESAEKGKYGDVKKYGQDCLMVTLGLDGQDASFTFWNASIIPHQVNSNPNLYIVYINMIYNIHREDILVIEYIN